MNFPIDMQSVVSPNLVVRFTSMIEGTVISADDRYEIGFHSVAWERLENKNTWKAFEFDLNAPLINEPIDIGNKYHKEVPGLIIDVYDVLKAFNVTNPATSHCIKKLLMPGLRGSKGLIQDLEEAANSLKRAIELEKGEPIE